MSVEGNAVWFGCAGRQATGPTSRTMGGSSFNLAACPDTSCLPCPSCRIVWWRCSVCGPM